MSLQDPQPGEQAAILIERVDETDHYWFLYSSTLSKSPNDYSLWVKEYSRLRTPSFYSGQVLLVEWTEFQDKSGYYWRPVVEEEDGQART